MPIERLAQEIRRGDNLVRIAQRACHLLRLSARGDGIANPGVCVEHVQPCDADRRQALYVAQLLHQLLRYVEVG